MTEEERSYLMSYGHAMRRAVAARQEYVMYASGLAGKGLDYDGTRGGSGEPKDMSGVILHKIDLEHEMMLEYKLAEAIRAEIKGAIDKLPAEDEKLIMTSRYLNLIPLRGTEGETIGYRWRSWREVAAAAGFSERYTIKLHARAVEDMRAKKDS